jgi:hypothetical protein
MSPKISRRRSKHHRVNAFQCQEVRGGQETFFAWITNFPVGPDTVVDLGNRGGRCRWKIENEGFNIQKNGGFNLPAGRQVWSMPTASKTGR